MFTNMKRFAAFLLALVMVFSLLPAGLVPVDAAEAPEEIADAAYAEADLVFNQLDAAEEEPAKKNKTTEEKVEDAIEIVVSSDSYVEDSLVRNGNSFTWWTDDGIQCVYSPRMREISEDLTPESGKNEIVNEPVPIKGGSPTGNQVYLIGPYYGHDSAFTNQYKNEAKRVAEAIGDTDGYTLYSGTSATVDKVAEAVANGAVVFFDSHGMTDYENPSNEWDCSTRATMSYLCLTSTTGLTSEDYNDGALYYSDGICINGATIANHMKKNSPGGILWMAICLGMATNTICNPLREMGVEVVYNHADYRLISSRVLKEFANFQEVNLFLRGIVPQIGYKWTTVTYERAERFAGESKYPLKKMLAFAADGITSFSVKPIRLVLSAGVVIFMISLLMLLYALVSKLTGHTSAGWTSLMGSIWLIGGIQLLGLGVVGEYIGKIYMESKARPRYIISERTENYEEK